MGHGITTHCCTFSIKSIEASFFLRGKKGWQNKMQYIRTVHASEPSKTASRPFDDESTGRRRFKALLMLKCMFNFRPNRFEDRTRRCDRFREPSPRTTAHLSIGKDDPNGGLPTWSWTSIFQVFQPKRRGRRRCWRCSRSKFRRKWSLSVQSP